MHILYREIFPMLLCPISWEPQSLFTQTGSMEWFKFSSFALKFDVSFEVSVDLISTWLQILIFTLFGLFKWVTIVYTCHSKRERMKKNVFLFYCQDVEIWSDLSRSGVAAHVEARMKRWLAAHRQCQEQFETTGCSSAEGSQAPHAAEARLAPQHRGPPSPWLLHI